jgi:antitoxin StbD
MQTSNYISATVLSKKTAHTLDSLSSGENEKFIILKNNAPKAILMSVDAYEALQEEIEDLRLTSLALARMQTFSFDDAISHKKMMEKFGR